MKVFSFVQKFALLTMILIISACGLPMQYQRDVSNFTPLPNLKLKVPTQTGKKAETRYTVAVVALSYESAMAESFNSQMKAAQAMQQAMLGGQVMFNGAYRKMDTAKTAYFEQVKKALQADLDQMLLAKNIRVTGPYKSREDMTFDEKKRAVYAFTPEIFLSVDTKIKNNSGGSGYIEEGDMVVNGIVTLYLRECITGEKIWVKRLDMDPVAKPYRMVAKFKAPRAQVANIDMMLKASVKEEDNTDVVFAEALSEFYSSFSDKLWKHIDPEEWEKYLSQAENLRKEKRY